MRLIPTVTLAALALAAPAQARPAYVPATRVVTLGWGAWSYFGDARAVTHGDHVFTGWISPVGDVWVAETRVSTGRTRKRRIFRGLGEDDHNNPSLTFWHGHLVAFFSPHSGHHLGKGAQIRFRVARGRDTIRRGFGATRRGPSNTPGGLGFTYPNPIRAGGRLFLFWRGGDWNPTFASTTNLRTWTRARTLVLGPSTPDDTQRPYAKYTEGPGDAFAMTFSDGHPVEYRNSLYYLRYHAGWVYRADGDRIGRLSDAPFTRSQVDTIYRFRRSGGRAWPQDIALDPRGHPVVAYTRRRHGPRGRDHFYYARFAHHRWIEHELASAGRQSHTFTSGGFTLDHSDPRRILLSRRVGRWNEVELWQTRDGGLRWRRATLTHSKHGFSMRPVFPRHYGQTGRTVVAYLAGRASSFLSFHTQVRLRIYARQPLRRPPARRRRPARPPA